MTDVLDALQTMRVDGVLTETFEYDANGNRLTYDTLIPGETCAAEYDEQDRIDRCTVAGGPSLSWTWDAFGSLASQTDHNDDTTLYHYDVLGNLREVVLPSGDVITYTIDAANRRVGRSVNGVFDRGWLYGDALNPVAELDSTGAVRAVFVYGTRGHVPDYMIRLDEGGEEYRFVTDVRGSVRLVVRASDGEVVQRIDYDEWGRVLRDTNQGYQPFGYAGGLYDPATGLVRFGARDYDARLGRWTARDPITFNGGQSNLYTYTDGNPVIYIDVSGTDVVVFVVEPHWGPGLTGIGSELGHVAVAVVNENGFGVISSPYGDFGTNDNYWVPDLPNFYNRRGAAVYEYRFFDVSEESEAIISKRIKILHERYGNESPYRGMCTGSARGVLSGTPEFDFLFLGRFGNPSTLLPMHFALTIEWGSTSRYSRTFHSRGTVY